MNRRGFLGSLVGEIAAAVAVRTFPFRVYSFPSKPTLVPLHELEKQHLDVMTLFLLSGLNLYSNDPRTQCRITGITVPTADEVELYA